MSVCLCIHVCAFLRLSLHVCPPVFFFFWCAECVPRVRIHILNHALFEVKMWLPAAIKRRQQLENKRAGGGAPGQLPCFRAGLHFSWRSPLRSLWRKDRWRGCEEREEREIEGCMKRMRRRRQWRTDGRDMSPTATSGWVVERESWSWKMFWWKFAGGAGDDGLHLYPHYQGETQEGSRLEETRQQDMSQRVW